MRISRPMKSIILTVAVAAILAGCGRRSDLDTPYQARMDARKEAQRNEEAVPPEPTPPQKDRPFILDRLIQ